MPVGRDIDEQDAPVSAGKRSDHAPASSGKPSESGAILPLFAILLVVLIGITGFAVDLGWMYFKSIEVQHGADIASLAGVVYEPLQRAKAHDEALAAAKQNGFVDATLGGPDSVLVEDIVDNPGAVEHASQLRVTIRHQIPTFFIRIFGINEVHITRSALAQYIEPLAMGSPDSGFGDDPSTGSAPGFWGSVHGNYGAQSWGDRFAALCDGNGGFVNPSCTPTGEARPSVSPGSGSATGGYVYGVEVFSGSSGLAVEIFDGPYYHYQDEVPVPGEQAALYWTGDYGDPSWGNPMATTWFMLYAPDATPLDTSDNTLLCSVRYAARDSRGDDYLWWDPTWVSFDEIDPSLLAQMWDSMATSADRTTCSGSLDAGAGIYPLRVMVEHNDGWWTTNKFSLRAFTASGPAPNIYGLGDMSMFTNVETGPPNPGTSTFYLAKVEDRYAGKTLIVELWDLGDVDERSVSDTLTIFSDSGTSVSCTWVATEGGSGSSCTLPVGDSGSGGGARFNDELITVTIPIPDTYTCSGAACWFRARYTYTGDLVHDTTTWAAFIAGNPIRLVE